MTITIHITASRAKEAQAAAKVLTAKYPTVSAENADVIVALGGDGFMLATLHKFMEFGKPIYGLNRGTIGFLMNEYGEDDLISRLETADKINIHPLRMTAQDIHNKTHTHLAMNEVSLLRESRQAAHICIRIDGKMRMEELVADGVLVATPAGSTAYNMSVYGPIMPLDSNLLALTPISACRPSRWRGALLPHDVNIELRIKEIEKRPVSAVADMHEIRDVTSVSVEQARDVTLTLMFDKERNLAERILAEQFKP